jgi:hypothetical protein
MGYPSRGAHDKDDRLRRVLDNLRRFVGLYLHMGGQRFDKKCNNCVPREVEHVMG